MKSPEQSEKREPTTFTELEEKENVSATELIETLKCYVESGWVITDQTVLSLIRRTELTEDERATVKQLAQRGAKLQTVHQESEAAVEYQRVVDQMDQVSAEPGE